MFLSTYSSWLNWIESEFVALRYFAPGGTDHRSHNEQDAAIGAYIRWHNQHARPNETSQSTPQSAVRITYPTLPDKAVEARGVRPGHRATVQGSADNSRVDHIGAACPMDGSS
ncbi:hypothetical protein [Nocardia donostiensis]|uniref:hypothetical protein n=1 Tax=Nocardia donostiensis TaxID=1538463 RepID=UPI00158C6CDE|nr:hypothetical protein [Nocardia donostiensis]